jgi:hypothetical protein
VDLDVVGKEDRDLRYEAILVRQHKRGDAPPSV